MADHVCQVKGLAVLVAELIPDRSGGLHKDLLQRGLGIPQGAADHMGQIGPGQEGGRAAVGHGHGLGAQQIHLRLLHPLPVEEHAHTDGGGETRGGGIIVHRVLQGSGLLPAQGIQHPGVHAVPLAELPLAQQPAVGFLRPSPGTLGGSPFPGGKLDILDEGGHFPQHLPPGQTQQQTVAGEGRQLGIRGNLRVTVHQVIAHEPVGAIVFLDLRPVAAVHSIAHGIPHGHTQQTAPIRSTLCSHMVSSFRFGYNARHPL